ncbi:MAG TPA: FAD-dependent oxidoreductase [Sphaerochaeta sp.]|nr:FAD-dependent oxidoreductase [Sphaerochaeta sp.]
MEYDVLVIGGGLSGLAAASLLAKRGLSVAVVDKGYQPGGSCGAFKRGTTTFDQGSSMMFGFGEKGFNSHRFVFNALEEPIDIIKHTLLYTVHFKDHAIKFHADMDAFIEELSVAFPTQRKSIQRFYQDMGTIYTHVMVDNPTYSTPDEVDKLENLKALLLHPISYARFLGYLNKSAKSLLEKYFTDPEIFNFFDKMTSTYCYATVEESPAILSTVMFVDNHVGGSYYPAGSTLFVTGKLEKVIEEHGGTMIMEREVTSILFADGKPNGVELDDGRKLYAKELVYSGTVWNLYDKLLPKERTTEKERLWASGQEPTYSSVVLYTTVKKESIPEDMQPIEMLVGNPHELDESEVTIYIPSIDDRSLCAQDEHIVMAIGPTFKDWAHADETTYAKMKIQELERLSKVLEKRIPGFTKAITYSEVATPRTIERYTMKNGGSVAGPKMQLGQHMFKRQHTSTKWDSLFCCGESTVLGTGTPTVTVSGLSAANAILKKRGLQSYVYDKDQKQFVNLLDPPYSREQLFGDKRITENKIREKASHCLFCEKPRCSRELDIRGVMRRVMVGNLVGARRIVEEQHPTQETLATCENHCIQNKHSGEPVAIQEVFAYLQTEKYTD